jgi:hypothetical protein
MLGGKLDAFAGLQAPAFQCDAGLERRPLSLHIPILRRQFSLYRANKNYNDLNGRVRRELARETALTHAPGESIDMMARAYVHWSNVAWTLCSIDLSHDQNVVAIERLHRVNSHSW